MNPFQIWLDAVDKALANSGKKITTKQLDPATLQRSFQSGMSPVIFAGQVQVPAPQPQPTPTAQPVYTRPPLLPLYPSHRMVKFNFWVMTILGWFCWLAGAYGFLNGLGIMAEASREPLATRAAATFGATIGLAIWAAVILAGCFLHYAAQKLAMAHYDFVVRGNP